MRRRPVGRIGNLAPDLTFIAGVGRYALSFPASGCGRRIWRRRCGGGPASGGGRTGVGLVMAIMSDHWQVGDMVMA